MMEELLTEAKRFGLQMIQEFCEELSSSDVAGPFGNLIEKVTDFARLAGVSADAVVLDMRADYDGYPSLGLTASRPATAEELRVAVEEKLQHMTQQQEKETAAAKWKEQREIEALRRLAAKYPGVL